MYYSHFGLDDPPFQLTTQPTALYMGKGHREAYSALEWGLLHESSGFTVLAGEVGTGKTTLILAILAQQFESLHTVYLSNPKLTVEEMIKVILKQLGVKAQGRSKLANLEALDNFLHSLPSGERVVIIVDEAHHLNDETIERLRLLSNGGKPEEKQLHFVLVGQPELLHRLRSPSLRQLDQRVGARCVLEPLKSTEVHEYIEQRLRANGGSTQQVFTATALREIVRHSRGIPRRVNVLCHNSMLRAYAAGDQQVNLSTARATVAEYDGFIAGEGSRERSDIRSTIRRRLGRALESLAMRLLGLARALNPQEQGTEHARLVELSPSKQSDDVVEQSQPLAS